MKTTLKIFGIIFFLAFVSNTFTYAQGYKLTDKYVPVSKGVARFYSASSLAPASAFRSVGTPEWLIAKGIVKGKNWSATTGQGNMESNYPWWTISKQVARINRK